MRIEKYGTEIFFGFKLSFICNSLWVLQTPVEKGNPGLHFACFCADISSCEIKNALNYTSPIQGEACWNLLCRGEWWEKEKLNPGILCESFVKSEYTWRLLPSIPEASRTLPGFKHPDLSQGSVQLMEADCFLVHWQHKWAINKYKWQLQQVLLFYIIVITLH